MPSKARTSSAVEYVTSGTYQRQDWLATAQTQTVGTEYEIAYVSGVIVAETANKNELFSWVRGQVFLYETAQYSAFEWFLVRMDTADAIPNLDDEPTAEKLQREKRIMSRGLICQGHPTYGGLRPIKFEVFNVKLVYGEELRLIIRPLVASGAAQSTHFGLLEWRQVGT